MTPTDQMEPRDLSFLLTVRFLSPWGGSMLLQHLQNLISIQNNHSRLPSPLSFWYYAGVHTASPVSRSFLPALPHFAPDTWSYKIQSPAPESAADLSSPPSFLSWTSSLFSPRCLTGTSVCGIFYLRKKGISLPQAIPLSYIQNYMYFYSFRQDIYLLYRSCKLAMYIILYVQKR